METMSDGCQYRVIEKMFHKRLYDMKKKRTRANRQKQSSGFVLAATYSSLKLGRLAKASGLMEVSLLCPRFL